MGSRYTKMAKLNESVSWTSAILNGINQAGSNDLLKEWNTLVDQVWDKYFQIAFYGFKCPQYWLSDELWTFTSSKPNIGLIPNLVNDAIKG